MKAFMCMFTIFVIGPLIALALLYGAFAFVYFDMDWAEHVATHVRGGFVFLSVFVAAFGTLGAVWLFGHFD